MAIIPSVDYYDELAASYEDAFSHDLGLQKFIQAALDLLPANSKVFDVGCGTGKPVSTTMAANGHRIQGIDLSPAMIELCRRQVPNGHFEAANMLEYHPTERIDADMIFTIFSLFCLGGRKETALMVSKLYTWLKPNGILCLGTICAEDLRTTPEMFDCDGMCANDVTMTFMAAFTREGWKQVLREAGFEIFYTQMDLFVLRRAADIASDDEMHYFIMARKASSGVKL
jgi:2-polyprenyl-3-methyl-5-hydroxy-6-metoxy-1,4-benzoquinol methylase